MKKLAVTFAVAILAISIFALDLWRNLDTGRDQYAALQTRVSELEAAQKAAPAPVQAPAAGTAEPQAIAGQTATPAAPAGTEKPPAERARNQVASTVTRLIESQEGQEMMRGQIRVALAQQYPDVAKELNLSPAEADKFFDLLAKQATAMTGDALGMVGGSQESLRKVMEKQKASEAELKAMLGSKYPQWETYQGTTAARQQVTQLRGLLGSGSNALTEEQSKPLVTALGAETARLNREMRDKMLADTSNPQNALEQQLQYATEQNRRLTDVASSHLSASQLDSYKKMLKQQEDMVRMVLGTMKNQGNAQGPGGAPR